MSLIIEYVIKKPLRFCRYVSSFLGVYVIVGLLMYAPLRRGRHNSKKGKSRKWKIIGSTFLVALVLLFLLVFVAFPIVFMNDIKLQRLLMFMNINLPTDSSFFQNYQLEGLRNLYVPIVQGDTTVVEIGVWHILPHNLTNQSKTDNSFSYDEALLNSNFSVLLNFHGAGEARSYFIEKDDVFRQFFHVINFDYRSFADSTRAPLSEDYVVYDCVQLYKWLLNKTNSPIFVWSHSLGTALATRMISVLKEENIRPKGLFLESGFTSMREELPVHPYGRIFAWLPWFEQTVLDPLEQNKFIFNTSLHVGQITCPVMVLHAEDDPVVPYKFGYRLYEIAKSRNITHNVALDYLFPKAYDYSHYFIYQDEHLPSYVSDFLVLCSNDTSSAAGI